MQRLHIYRYVVLLVLLLAACTSSPLTGSDTASEDETALFSEVALRSARGVRIVSEADLVGVELNTPEVPSSDEDIPDIEVDQGQLSPAAVLPATTGMLSYYRSNGTLFQIYTHDQGTDTPVRISSNANPVQSVASSLDSNYVVASISIGGQYDVYVFDVPGVTVTNLTNTASQDELDVSMTADASKIAWTSQNNIGVKRITLCTYTSATQACTLVHLTGGGSNHQIQGSISSNGDYVALIRVESTLQRVRLYNVAANTYTNIIASSEPLSHPSSSDDGQQVMYLRDRTATTGTILLRVANLANSTTSTELSSTSISHAHMTRDAKYVAYDGLANGFQRVFTRNMTTNQRVAAQGGNWNYYAPYWQKPMFVSISAGDYHSLGLDNAGNVWAWGYNFYGSLGDGTTTSRSNPVAVCSSGSGAGCTQFNLGSGGSVDLDNFHSLAVDSSGNAWSWGNNGSGQLGDGTINQRTNPVAVCASGSGAGCTQLNLGAGGSVSAGWQGYSLAVDGSGNAWAWGANNNGQLGDGTTTQRSNPVAVCASGSGAGCTQLNLGVGGKVSAGWIHSLGVSSGGNAWAWGSNSYGALGDGTTTQRLNPVAVCASGSGAGCTQLNLGSGGSVSAGWYHSLAVSSSGSAWSWGLNSFGELGDGTTTQRLNPVAVCSSSSGAGCPQLNLGADGIISAGGERFSLALATNGNAWGWGYNFYGQVGDGTTTSRSNPVAVYIP